MTSSLGPRAWEPNPPLMGTTVQRPRSFITYFPPQTQAFSTSSRDMDGNASWISRLLAPSTPTLRTWDRTPCLAKKVTSTSRTIRKRSTAPTAYSWDLKRSQSIAISKSMDIVMRHDDLTPAARRPKTIHKEHTMRSDESTFAGSPPSAAETANMIMEAKVDTVNAWIDGNARVRPNAKRGTSAAFGFGRKRGEKKRGNTLAFLWGMAPLVDRAVDLREKGRTLDVAAGAITSANVATYLSTHHEPRTRVYLHGIPDLSDVKDVTEAESSLAGNSPAKTPSSGTVGKSPRLTLATPKLVPGHASSSGISPTKSSPVVASPQLNTASSSARRKSVGQLVMTSQVAITPNNGRGTYFLPLSSPSNEDSADQTASPSPTKRSPPTYQRPEAPTPSRGNHAPIETPVRRQSTLEQQATAVETPMIQQTPLAIGTPVIETPAPAQGATPKTVSFAALAAQSTQQDLDLDFGLGVDALPYKFVSPVIPLAYSGERAKSASEARRRRSEPFQQSNHARRMATPRRSLGVSTVAKSPTRAFTPTHNVSNVSSVTQQLLRETAEDVVRQTIQTDGNPFVTHDSTASTIDARVHPDIFSDRSASPMIQAQFDALAQMAENKCGGQAKVLVSIENAKLVVRFKLSAEHEHKFVATMDSESNFSMSPELASKSPRIKFNAPLAESNVASPEAATDMDESMMSFRDETVDLVNPEEQADMDDSMISFPDDTVALATPTMVMGKTTDLERRKTDSSPTPAATLQAEEDMDDSILSFPDETVALATPTIVMTETEVSHYEAISSTAPALESMDTTVEASATSLADLDSTMQVPDFVNSTPAPVGNESSLTTEDLDAQLASAGEQPKSNASPAVRDTFRPVNKSPAAKASLSTHPTAPENADEERTSDEFDYHRKFVSRNKASKAAKQAAATETGSPIAQAKRQPLGIMSPNVASPSKRKAEVETSKPVEESPERLFKKARRVDREKAEAAKPVEDDDTRSRRSSRIRAQPATAKSALPKPAQILSRSTPGFPLSRTRAAQHELALTTSTNTRRNRGNSQYPKEVLARLSHEDKAEEEIAAKSDSEVEGKGKGVAWREPLVSKDKATRRGRSAKAKAGSTTKVEEMTVETTVERPVETTPAVVTKTKVSRATKASGIAKPVARTAAASRAGSTPMRPGRVTRSRALQG